MRRLWLLNLLIAALLASGTAIGSVYCSPFLMKTQRDSDRIDVCLSNSSTIFSIHSPFGISQAVIERTADHWPEKVVLRFYLAGLERLQIQCGETVLNAAVSSQRAPLPNRLWRNDQEDQPLDSTSPLWMEIRILTGDGKPTQAIPLKEGCFEMRLPQTLLDGNPKSITLKWIDFYRS